MSGRSPAAQRAVHLLLGPGAEAMAECGGFCAPGDAVVLIGAGTLVLALPEWSVAFPASVTFACLRADALAHGLVPAARAQQVALLEDADLVGLVRDCPHCLSWT